LKALSTLHPYFYQYRWYLVGGTIFIIISTFFSILPAYYVREAFDLIAGTLSKLKSNSEGTEKRLMEEQFHQSVLVYGLLILGMALLRGLFMFFMRQTIIVMSRHIEFDQKNEMYRHYQSLPLSFYRRNNTGDLMARISEDVGRVRMYTGPAIMYGINLLVTFIMLISYMFSINVSLTLWVLMPLPILSLSIYFVNNTINRRSEAIQESVSNLSTFVQEAFSGVRVAKAFSREEHANQRFTEENNEFWKRSMRLNRVESLFFPLIMALIGLSTLFAVTIGGMEVAAGRISNGVIAEFIIYVNLLTWPVTSLGWTISIIQRAEASQKRINEFLNEHNPLHTSSGLRSTISGHILFKGVSYTYPETGTHAVADLSFEVPEGETLAIVGTTGAGKSTIANLLCRMMDPDNGQILLDGQPLSAYDVTYLRSHIGYVPQDVFLFSDTIRQNILFGADQESDEAMQQAAKRADLAENVNRFPKGFETMLGERGITLSGGQKQRVSIARALVRDPEVLILDDCLSAVDTRTENEILNNLRSVTHNRTTIIISHRLSSVKLAHKIIVLHEGRLMEQGTHDELYEMGGIYRELYEKQLEKEEEV
jgi:ATP-binding cassette, subfamily B, multidrug efflux pump